MDVNESVRDLLKMVGAGLGPEVRVKVELKEGLPRILGDRVHIEQVLLNLAINARDAMPEGGTIRFVTGLTDVTPDEANTMNVIPGRFVSLSVSDEGEGMDDALVKQIFHPFVTRKQKGKGLGLGLAVALNIVKAHRGFMRVQSKKGAGTTFHVSLPAGST